MFKILYVEDDPNLGYVTKDALEESGFEVIHVTDGKKGWEAFQMQSFDICLLDVMLPQVDGFTLAEKIRSNNFSIPIIFLTAKGSQEDRINGLQIGADDYVIKPFHIDELILRIRVFLKRKAIQEWNGSGDILKLGSFTFYPSEQKLQHTTQAFHLTHRETEVLQFLAIRLNQIVKREDILVTIWGRDDYFLGRSLDVFISRLRKMLSLDTSVKIENVHGIGFKLSNLTE